MFVVASSKISSDIYLDLKFSKEMNLRELIDCELCLRVVLNEELSISRGLPLRYVFKDKMISFEELMDKIKELINILIQEIRAINSGINLTPNFYINIPGIDNTDIEIRREIIKTLENINEYKLQSNVIEIYTILTSYKGTDQLQKKKFEKMIEAIQDANNFIQGGF